jgi:hypothetical protein
VFLLGGVGSLTYLPSNGEDVSAGGNKEEHAPDIAAFEVAE